MDSWVRRALVIPQRPLHDSNLVFDLPSQLFSAIKTILLRAHLFFYVVSKIMRRVKTRKHRPSFRNVRFDTLPECVIVRASYTRQPKGAPDRSEVSARGLPAIARLARQTCKS